MSNPSSPIHKRVRGLLAEDGEVRVGPPSTRGLVLSRARCRFRRFVAPLGLTRAQRDRAALLNAEAHAPFANAGWLVLRSEEGAEIWYWDRDLLPPGALSPTPEAVWRSSVDGWHVLRCIDGYEAQYVKGGVLLATTWRREPFDMPHWASFVASVEAVAADVPEVAPQPRALTYDGDRWRRRVIKPPLGWRDLEQGAWTVAAVAVALTLFFVAQAMHHQVRAGVAAREARQVDARLAADADIRRARERQGLGLAVSEVVGGPSVAMALAEILVVLDGYAVEPRSIAVENGEFRATFDQPERPVRELVRGLEETGRLCSVTPEIAGAGVVELRASLRAGGAGDCADALDRYP